MKKLQDLQIIRLADRHRLAATVAAAALAAGIGGVLIGRSMIDAPPAVEQSEEGGEAEEHGPEGFVPMTAEKMTASDIAVEPGIFPCELAPMPAIAVLSLNGCM